MWHAFGNIWITEQQITKGLFMKSGLRLGSSEVDEFPNIQFQQWRILLPNTRFFYDMWFHLGKEVMRKWFIFHYNAEQLFKKKKKNSNKNTTPTVFLAYMGSRVQTPCRSLPEFFILVFFPPLTLKTGVKKRDFPPSSFDTQ